MTTRAKLSRFVIMAISTSLVLGSVYPLIETALPPVTSLLCKGLCVGLLALAALLSARNTDGYLLAAVMAAGAAGDVLLGISFKTGAAAFAVGHIIAIALYLRNRRQPVGTAAMAGIVLLLGAGLALPRYLVPGDVGLATYALLLTGMAAAALASRFDRRVAVGALMFLVSDALIAVRMQSPPGDGLALGLAIWWLYYFGQLLIFWFVLRAIRSAPAR